MHTHHVFCEPSLLLECQYQLGFGAPSGFVIAPKDSLAVKVLEKAGNLRKVGRVIEAATSAYRKKKVLVTCNTFKSTFVYTFEMMASSAPCSFNVEKCRDNLSTRLLPPIHSSTLSHDKGTKYA